MKSEEKPEEPDGHRGGQAEHGHTGRQDRPETRITVTDLDDLVGDHPFELPWFEEL